MKYDFLKVASATPEVKVADCRYNADQIIQMIHECNENKTKLVVFPELCITAYTCGDLFLQKRLLDGAMRELERITSMTKGMDLVVVLGLPMVKKQNLYNVAAVIQNGKILGIVPKKNIPNYSEFYEARYFKPGNEEIEYVTIAGKQVPFGVKLIFECTNVPLFTLGVEVCEDVWVPIPPSSYHAMAGAMVIANVSASDETTGKDGYRHALIGNQSARLISGYIYTSAGSGESTTDVVYSGHNLIMENGTLLAQSKRFINGNHITYSEIDLGKLDEERRRMTTYQTAKPEGYEYISFELQNQKKGLEECKLTRFIDKAPFVPNNTEQRKKRCDEILNIQANGLRKRLLHTNCKSVVIGISGGLDSTLALLVAVRAFEMLALDKKDIIAVTMPCFGTTDRTYNNAVNLTKKLGATLKEIRINEAVEIHLRDIGHDINVHDVTYENAQARERTQILMNIANKVGGMVIGTGDMSELALGWATYNGDHMSMYGVNCSVPKTLVRYLVEYYAITYTDHELRDILLDILATPVSPELLPPKDGVISQKTEDIVGPYELHDFFLYNLMRFGYTPKKILHLAEYAFAGDYDRETILKWLKTFYFRFFSQQFKRSCLPDGPKVGSVALSPRGDLRMPSDACVALWMEELEEE
ncbi:MAG: NAD(+) synthase [bacterium]|nr:NAD(+) synthase [bacterium]